MSSWIRLLGRGAAIVALGLPALAMAQTTSIDEGSFRLLIRGREVGTETFSIRHTGSGNDAQVIASGRVTVDAAAGGDVTSVVQLAGPTLRPATYQIQVEGEPGQRLSGSVAGRRVSARIVSQAGENVREYLVSEGAVVIDDAVAHHYYILARRVRSGETRVPVIVPREALQTWVDVAVQPDENLVVGGTSIACRKLQLRPERGESRTLWVDSEDRIIRLEIPASGFVAERLAPPR